MKLLVTGSSGFLGRYVVAEALRRGHQVRALVRPVAVTVASEQSNLEVVRADLRDRRTLAEVVAGVDAVLHLAAVKQGDLYVQLAGTVVATENLLAAMSQSKVNRLVAVSTIAVYDYLQIPFYGRLDESTPIEHDPERRETYTQSKLQQEKVIQRYASDNSLDLTILRPGVIYDREHCWFEKLGIRLSDRLCLRFGVISQLPLTYVENCAQAILECTESDEAIGQVFNVIDDNTPSRRAYVKQLRKRMKLRPWVVVLPGALIWGTARFAEFVNRVVFKNEARLPWFLSPPKLALHVRPLCYANQKLHDLIGWRPRYHFPDTLDRGGEAELEVRPDGAVDAA